MIRIAKFMTLFVLSLAAMAIVAAGAGARDDDKTDPAAWGDDHVGKPLPDYFTGDECLFCHRDDIGPGWSVNRHGHTIRFAIEGEAPMTAIEEVPELKEMAAETVNVMGGENRIRFLKRGQGYGKLDLASVHLVPGAEGEPAEFLHAENPTWDVDKFAQSCAGCHATAVEEKTAAMSAIAIDCYSCHGIVDLGHTSDTKLIHLSRKRKDSATVVASTCGQCHLRGGTSRSTGRPYPTQFVPGDNLFKDYEVDFSDEFIDGLNPGDRHIYRNIREITIDGNDRVTCLSCHEVHGNSSQVHASLRRVESCNDCHAPDRAPDTDVSYEVHSDVCEY